MELQFATIWEAIADAVPGQTAIVCGPSRLTWGAYDSRAARLARALHEAGVARDSKVALYLHNCPEYLETQFASFKLSAIPVNVNYRYREDELTYILDNSDSEVVVYHSSLSATVGNVRKHLPKVRLWLEVDDGGSHLDGAVEYEQAVSTGTPHPRAIRRADDTYMLYTGGTTGTPKGVMYRQGPFIARYLQRAPLLIGERGCDSASDAVVLATELAAAGRQHSSMPACPLMHGSGQWVGVFATHLLGGRTVLLTSRGLDAAEIWGVVEREAVAAMVIVGDAFGRPMLRHLNETERAYDLSALRQLHSAGAIFSAETKQGLLDHIPNMVIIDSIGGSEGSLGSEVTTRGTPVETASFKLLPSTKVFTESGEEVSPGSGEIGYLAASGGVPYGYYKDAEKSAATFREIDGVRYAFLGDMATVRDDGSIHLLGRGNKCVNTAGEKVFPEEVEEAAKTHPAVEDCLVFGVPDVRLGQRVVAVVETPPNTSVTAEDVAEHIRSRLAGFKVPRDVKVVDRVPRTASGKADYDAAQRLYKCSNA